MKLIRWVWSGREVLARAIRPGKEIKGIQIEREDDVTLYIENPRE